MEEQTAYVVMSNEFGGWPKFVSLSKESAEKKRKQLRADNAWELCARHEIIEVPFG